MPYRQVRLKAFGEAEMLETVTLPQLPDPAGAGVRVRVLVTSAAFTDVMIRKGLYPDVKDRPPFVPGYDMVGVVDSLGPEARVFRPGDRVADLTTIGAYSEYLCLPEDRLTPVPDGLDEVAALGAILTGVTPYQMLHRVARVQPGQSILIHGAGGAVGTTMLQLAKLAGLRAYGTDTEAKHDLIRGLGGIPLPPGPQAGTEALGAADRDGVDVVFDPLGGESLARSLHLLRPGGLLVGFGFLNEVMGRGGSIPLDLVRLKLWDWLPNGHATAFYSIGAMRRAHPDWFRTDLAALFGLMAEGKLSPVVAREMPLEAAAEAHRLIESGEAGGKIVLRVGAP